MMLPTSLQVFLINVKCLFGGYIAPKVDCFMIEHFSNTQKCYSSFVLSTYDYGLLSLTNAPHRDSTKSVYLKS